MSERSGTLAIKKDNNGGLIGVDMYKSTSPRVAPFDCRD